MAERVKTLLDRLNKELSKVPFLRTAEEATGVNKEYLFLGGSVVSLLVLLFVFGANFICNLVGFLYPAYQSFKAIESETKADDTQWLTYWVVYAAFNIVEAFLYFLVQWIPFYYALKLGFLIWCFYPATQGATFLYENALKEVFVPKSKAASVMGSKRTAEAKATIIGDAGAKLD